MPVVSTACARRDRPSAAVAELDHAGNRQQSMKAKTTEETIRNKILCLLGLVLAGLWCSGCSHVPSDWRTHPLSNPASLTGRTTMVVPVKGEPVILQNSQVGAALLGGIFAVAINEALLDKPKRNTLITNMAGPSAVFYPEVVLAEECVEILKRGNLFCSPTVTLFRGLEILHGAGPEIEGETRVFKPSFSNHEIKVWNQAHSQWLAGPPVHTPSPNETGSAQMVLLEVTVVTPCLRGGTFYLGLLMRLVDPISGTSLAAGYAEDSFSAHKIRRSEDLPAFIVDYRKCARQLSETLLKQLKLMP